MACAWELAICYFSGFGVPKSFPDCSDWLSTASAGGVAAAHKFSKPLFAAMKIPSPQLQKGEHSTSFSIQSSTGPILEHSAADTSHRVAVNKLETGDQCIVDGLEDHHESPSQHPCDTNTTMELPKEVYSLVETGSLTDLQSTLVREPELLNSQDSNGDTLLLLAVRRQRRDLLEFLLSQPKLDASICNNSQRTVLHELTSFDGPTVCRVVPQLLAHNADIYQEALPKASHDMGMSVSLGIRCDSLLNSILHGNLDLLECLVKACHSSNAKIPCQICESGSRFRRTLAISLSIFRADAVELLVEHMKAHREPQNVDFSRLKVWAGQDLLPLHKVPFNSVIITAMDLPDSLFRAMNYGSEYNEFLDRTICFLLTTVKHENVPSLAYMMLNEAVTKNNTHATACILRWCKSRRFPNRWWLKWPAHTSPFIESIRLGHREVYQMLLEEDPIIFYDYIGLQCSKDCDAPVQSRFRHAIMLLFGPGLNSTPRSMKIHIHNTNHVETALMAFVQSPHKDMFFL